LVLQAYKQSLKIQINMNKDILKFVRFHTLHRKLSSFRMNKVTSEKPSPENSIFWDVASYRLVNIYKQVTASIF